MDFFGDLSALEGTGTAFEIGEDATAYCHLGCHPLPEQGWVFRLYASDAAAVSLVGDFNGWDIEKNPMEQEGGLWVCACQQAQAYQAYRYHIVTKDGQAVWRTDPLAVARELPPGQAGLVYAIGGHRWQEPCPTRAGPVSVYRLPPDGWRRYADGRPYGFATLAEQLAPYVAQMGYTHLLADGLLIPGTIAPEGALGTPHELMDFVEACHRQGVGVLLPYSLPADARFDDLPCRSVWLSAAAYLLETYRLDGLAVALGDTLLLPEDAPAADGRENRAAEAFWRVFTRTLKENYPHAMLVADGAAYCPLVAAAEGLGFDYTLSAHWAGDMARYTALPFWERKHFSQLLTSSLLHPFAQRYMLPLGPGDTYPAGAMPGDYPQRLAGLRALMGYQTAHPGAKLTVAGTELGQLTAGPPDWLLLDYEEHRMLRHYAATLSRLYRDTPALWQRDDTWEGLRWISDEDAYRGILTFYRQADTGPPLVVAVNLSDTLCRDYGLGLPQTGLWAEVLRSDLAEFGGAVPTGTAHTATPVALHGQPAQIRLDLPPLTVVFLQPK